MARKRMIDPSFWTDSVMVTLPHVARLFYIGSWNFADDYGFLDDDAVQLALQIFPGEPVDGEALIDLLIAAGRFERYAYESGETYLRIARFEDHQKVTHPAVSRYKQEPGAKKQAIPAAARRELAIKYGMSPEEEHHDAQCVYCGASGSIYWPRTRNGRPGGWVAFSGLEIDHAVPESGGGATSAENFVLACRECNRRKGSGDGSPVFRRIPEDSGKVQSPHPNLDQVSKGQVKENSNGANAPMPADAGGDGEDEAKSVSYSPEFETFWRQYPRGRGSKSKSFTEWRKLRRTDRDDATAAIPAWVSCEMWQDPSKVIYCERWLKARSWENDPPPPAKQPVPIRRNGRPTVQELVDLANQTYVSPEEKAAQRQKEQAWISRNLASS